MAMRSRSQSQRGPVHAADCSGFEHCAIQVDLEHEFDVTGMTAMHAVQQPVAAPIARDRART